MRGLVLRSLAVGACSVPLAGCFGFTSGVDEPDLPARTAQLQSRILPGATTRQEVRGLLGMPIYASPAWGVEVYRSDETDTSTDWLVVLMVPVPGWTEVRDYRLYPLVVYSPAGVVESIATGSYAEHHRGGMINGAMKSPGSANADALGFTLVVDACDEPTCLWLLAPAARGLTDLRAPPATGRCILDLAKPGNGIEASVDDSIRLRSNGTSFGWNETLAAEPWFARVAVEPGVHTVRATHTGPSLAVGGELRRAIECRGDQLFVVRVAARFEPAGSFFGRARLAGEIEVLDSADSIPDDARLILFHGNQSLTAAD